MELPRRRRVSVLRPTRARFSRGGGGGCGTPRVGQRRTARRRVVQQPTGRNWILRKWTRLHQATRPTALHVAVHDPPRRAGLAHPRGQSEPRGRIHHDGAAVQFRRQLRRWWWWRRRRRRVWRPIRPGVVRRESSQPRRSCGGGRRSQRSMGQRIRSFLPRLVQRRARGARRAGDGRGCRGFYRFRGAFGVEVRGDPLVVSHAEPRRRAHDGILQRRGGFGDDRVGVRTVRGAQRERGQPSGRASSVDGLGTRVRSRSPASPGGLQKKWSAGSFGSVGSMGGGGGGGSPAGSVAVTTGYDRIMAMCKSVGASITFTCAEMSDREHNPGYLCGPEGLLRQVVAAAARAGVDVAAENALYRCDAVAFKQMVRNCKRGGSRTARGCARSRSFACATRSSRRGTSPSLRRS